MLLIFYTFKGYIIAEKDSTEKDMTLSAALNVARTAKPGSQLALAVHLYLEITTTSASLLLLTLLLLQQQPQQALLPLSLV